MSTNDTNSPTTATPSPFKAQPTTMDTMMDTHPYLEFCTKLCNLLKSEVDDIQQVNQEVQQFLTDFSVTSWFDLHILLPDLLPKTPAVKAMRLLHLHQYLCLGNKVKDRTDMKSIIKKLEELDP